MKQFLEEGETYYDVNGGTPLIFKVIKKHAKVFRGKLLYTKQGTKISNYSWDYIDFLKKEVAVCPPIVVMLMCEE